MEDSEISTNVKTSSVIPALGLLGLGVGIIALALGILAMVKVGDTSASMNDKIEKTAALALDVKKLSDRVDSLALQIEEIKSSNGGSVENLAKKTQMAITEIVSQLNQLKGEIAEDRKSIELIAKRPARASANAPTSDESRRAAAPDAGAKPDEAQAKADSATPQAEGKKIHIIQSGDTFAKLANKYKTTTEAIMSLNPKANPSRLMIGQKILIP